MNKNKAKKTILKALYLITLLFFLSATFSHAAFEINKLGPKASAFNDAYSALAGDGWGILYNPAQSVRLDGARAGIAYSRPYLNFGNFRADLVSGLFTREALGTGYGVGVIFTDTNVFYREITGLFNMAHRFGEEEDDWDFSLGANLKILSLRRGDPSKPYDPALVPQTMNRFSADIGTHLRYRKYFLGISAQNVVPANVGVVVKEFVPIETRVGVGAKEIWDIPRLGFKVSPVIEVSSRNQDTVATGGAEIKLLDFASFILGAGTRNVTMGFSVLLNKIPYRSGRRPLDNKNGRDGKKTGEDSALRGETLYCLDVGYAYPITGLDNVGSPLLGMSFLF